MERCGVAIEPAEVLHKGRLDVVVHCAVVATQREVLGKRPRELNHLTSLDHGEALIRSSHGLIVDEFVCGRMTLEMLIDSIGAPYGPVVRRVHDLGDAAPLLARLAQVLCSVI